MQSQHIDTLVLGSGVVGQSVAYESRERGLTTAVVETREPGGTCPNRGCDAKKPLVNAARVLREFQALAGKGLNGDASIDWQQLIAYKKTWTDPVGDHTADDLRDAGVTLLQGPPRFSDQQTVVVNDTAYQAQRIVIATGQRPRRLDIPGIGHTIDSDGFLDLESLPPRVAFIGGGYIGMEFACVAAAAGSQVTVIEHGQYPLKAFDNDMVQTLLAELARQGVRVLTHRDATAIELMDGGAKRIVCDESPPDIEVDLVVAAAGRVASLDGMRLDTANVQHSERGVAVDGHLRSVSNPRVWAGGDVADNGRPPLVPTASQDARTLSHNLFHDEPRKHADSLVATLAFTTPPIGSVGLTEDQAREQHREIDIVAGSMTDWKLYRQHGHAHGSYKLLFAPDNGPLVGAHLCGHGGEELINLLALAICQGCNRDALCRTALAYPTFSFTLHKQLQKQRH